MHSLGCDIFLPAVLVRVVTKRDIEDVVFTGSDKMKVCIYIHFHQMHRHTKQGTCGVHTIVKGMQLLKEQSPNGTCRVGYTAWA